MARVIFVLLLFISAVSVAATSFHYSINADDIDMLLSSKINNREITGSHTFARERISRTKTVADPFAKKSSLFTVVIDAGHGGKDPGAIGFHGTREKDVVLSIAKKLAAKINQLPHMQAILTRNGDYFIPLRERLKFARKDHADLFIAIHADAYFNNHKKGASVYALSERGATSEAARWLARRDNYSELGQLELNTLQDHSHVLRSVLIDLVQTATIRDSIKMGNKMLAQLDKVSSLHHTKVEQAPFVVLKSPDIPSILVETGFITNRYEEKRLANPIYQQQLANAMSISIYRYAKNF